MKPPSCCPFYRDPARLRQAHCWSWDPDPGDSTFLTDYAYLLREEGQDVQIAYDRHVNGLFGRQDWLRCLAEVGFQSSVVTDQYGRDVFVGVRPVEESAYSDRTDRVK
jgi:hypothetical protein